MKFLLVHELFHFGPIRLKPKKVFEVVDQVKKVFLPRNDGSLVIKFIVDYLEERPAHDRYEMVGAGKHHQICRYSMNEPGCVGPAKNGYDIRRPEHIAEINRQPGCNQHQKGYDNEQMLDDDMNGKSRQSSQRIRCDGFINISWNVADAFDVCKIFVFGRRFFSGSSNRFR